MSVFRNVRIYPDHGARAATITWELLTGTPAGDVYVAFSVSGTDGSWEALNPTDPVPSAVGTFQHVEFVMRGGSQEGFYRLMLTEGGNDHMSESFQILGDVTAREYGIVRAMIHREFTEMRVANGYPVWHCIPREHGEKADNYDPDTDSTSGAECGDGESYGLPYKGGFYDPVLTWMRPMEISQGVMSDDLSMKDVDNTKVRMMAFPRPRLRHMIVDPASGRRYLVPEIVKPYMLRGVIPTAFETILEFLNQSDARYRFDMPALDTKAYRRIPYWTPTTTP